MAFLFQDQNQGIRNDFSHPQMRGAAATVLFHPDFNRRLRIHTESADPSSLVPPNRVPQKNKALAGLGYVTLTAGGDFHPALRTSAARLGNLPESMTKRRLGSKSLRHGDLSCRHVPTASLVGTGGAPCMPGSEFPRADSSGKIVAQKLTIEATANSDSGLFSN